MDPIDPMFLERVELLLAAIADVAPPDHPPPIARHDASPAYLELHSAYVTELTASVEAALDWWNGSIALAMKRNRWPRPRAEKDAFQTAPAGPASHGRVMATVRRYWLRCDAMNREPQSTLRVPPEYFVLGWLVSGQPALAQVLSRYTFFPVGLDAETRWV